MNLLESLESNSLIVALISIAVGALMTVVGYRIKNRIGVFRYTISTNKIAFTADDSVFGSVRVNWQERLVRNLHLVTISVKNSTSRDYERVKFTIYSGNETQLLTERTRILDTPHILNWSPSFRDRMRVENGEVPSEDQNEEYYHCREYETDVFNRGQQLEFSYLCTRPNDDLEPGVFLDTRAKGVKLKLQSGQAITIRPFLGAPVMSATARGLVIVVLSVLVCGLFLQNIWLVSIICVIVGLSSHLLGAIAYRIERYISTRILG